MKNSLYSASLLMVMALLFGLSTTRQAAAQDAEPVVDTCADVRFLMARNTTPDQLLQGGGILQSNTPTGGQVGAGTDMGDYWLFTVDGASNSTNLNVTFTDLPADVQLEFALFQGMTRITASNTYQLITAGETYTLPTRTNGVYTLVTQLANISDLENLSQTVGYTLTANFQSGGDVITAVNSKRIRDSQSNQDLMQGENYEVVDGKQVFAFRSGTNFKTNATSLKSVTQMPDKAGRLDFDGGGTLIVDSWAQEISLLGGNLSVVGEVNKTKRIYYLENFGPGQSLINPIQSNLADITDSNRTHIVTDWAAVTGIWVMTDCMGYKLDDGHIFTAVIDGQTTQRNFQALGRPDGNVLSCNSFLTRMSALNALGKTVDETMCLNWKSVEANTEMTVRGGVLEASLVAGRSIKLQSDTIRMVPLAGSAVKNADSADLPLDIQVADGGQPVGIKLDWTNLAHFGYADEGTDGRTLSFSFLDEPRTSTTRPGANLLSVDAVEDVLHIVYRGDGANGTNGRELLLLPRNESYIELVTPAGTPTFNGASFNGQALPNAAGYQARALNNLGGECYPVNTLLEQINCAPNGNINPANGNLWYSVTDLTAYHPAFNLSLTRSYNSYNFAADGAFGPGWSSDFPLDYAVSFDAASNSRLVDLANAEPDSRINYRVGLDTTWATRGIVQVTTASGSQHEFVRDDKATGTQGEVYRALTMPGWSLSRSGGNSVTRITSNWTLTETNGLTYTFDRAGRMRSLGYPAQGYAATINYPWDNNLSGPGALGDKPVTITDSTNGRQIELFYDTSHHIVMARLRDVLKADTEGDNCDITISCFEVKYSYSNGRLSEVTYPGGQKATYSYDDIGRLVRHDDPHAPIAPIMGYSYDVVEEGISPIGQGALTAAYILREDEPLPKDDSFLWRKLDTVLAGDKRQVTVTDENGTSNRFVYQLAAGSLTSAGESYTLLESSHLWAAAGSFEAVPTKYEWAAGQLAAIPVRFLPGAASVGRNRVGLNTDANGQLTGISGGYPGLDITTVNGVTQFPVRQIVPDQLRFADGSGWRFGGYNAAGFFTSYTDTQGARYTVERDEQNRPTRVVRNDDQVSWQLAYDSSGMVSSVQQMSNIKNDASYTVQYQWDGLGRLTAVADDLLGAYQINYLPPKQAADGTFYSEIAVTDPAGAVTISRFDGRNRLIETRVQANAEAKDYLSRTTYEYDAADKLGRVSARVRWLVGADGETTAHTSYRYEAQPQLDMVGEAVAIGGTKVTQTDAYGRETIAVYDDLGRIRLMGSPEGELRRFDYTVEDVHNPLPANQINPNGLKIVEQDYLTGRLTATTDYLFDYGWQLTGVIRHEQNPFASAPASWSAEWRLFSQTVNSLNPNVRSLIAPVEAFPDPGIVWSDTYTNGRPTQVTAQRTNPLTGKPDIDPNLKTTFDFLGRPNEVTQTVNGQTQSTLVTYCAAISGRTLELRAKPGAPAVACDRPADAALELTYDGQQRLIATRDDSASRAISYSPDTVNGGTQVDITATNAAGDTTYTWTLVYDAAAHLTTWVDEHNITHSYTYDTLGRLSAVTVANQPEASFVFTYNLADLLTRQVDGTGRGYAYSYDAAGHLVLQQNVLTKDSVSYTYDTRGQLSSQISPLGSVTTYEYNDPVDATRLTAIITAAGREQFSWNDAKASVTYTNPGGRQTVYTFDGLGALWQINSPEGRLYQLIYNEAGSLTGWQVREGTSSHVVKLDYDFAKNQITVGAEGVDWSWAFDLTTAGELAGVTNPSGQKLGLSYDPLGKLAGINAGAKLQWKLQYTAGTPELKVTDSQGVDSTYSFDALYRLAQQQGEADSSYEYAWSGSPNGLVNARLTDTDGTQIYTFWPGDERQPPQIIVRTAGQRLIYTYNTEGLLDTISREVCLVEPFADLKGAALDQINQLSPTSCEDETSPDVWVGSGRFLYDSLGQPIRTIDSEQNSESFTYDAAGNLVSYQNPDGKTYSYSYDGLNRVSRISSPAGIDLLFSYALDSISGVCQARSLDRLDYAGCAAQDGVLENYSYDGLGRRLNESFPLVNGNGQVSQSYSAAGGGAPTEIGGQSLTYTLDALGLLKRNSEQELSYAGGEVFTGINGDSGLNVTYDKQGRLATLEAQGQSLSIEYAADSGGYTIKDDKSGAALTFTAGGNGLIDSINYTPGNPDEENPVLQIQYIGQENNGLTSFSLLWGDDYITDFRANRRGENIYLNHQTQDFDLGLTLDTVHNSSGLLQRQVITGGNNSAAYFSSKVTGGYITVLGYDQNDRLLTMRMSESEGNRLLYQATYVYSSFGQLTRETRQYEDGTQSVIGYRYDTKVRNLLVGTDVNISQAKPAEQSAVGMIALLLLGSGGAIGLRRYGGRRFASGLAVVGIMLGAVGFMPTNPTRAQENDVPVTQARYSYTYDGRGNLVSVTAEGGDICAAYTYDAANNLTGVTGNDKITTAYRYDSYGRLVAAGKTSLIYVGAAQTPLMVVEDGQPRFYAQTADGNLLFQASGDSITPFISSGDRQVLGTRPYGTAETPDDVHPVWLFDPFGRYLTLSAPGAVTNPCELLAKTPDASIPNFLPAFNGMLWDTQANLYFGQGRAYSPALARFLQRDPLGPDAQGNVYDFAARRSTPPVRTAGIPYMDGLAKLTSASAVQTQITVLGAASIANQYAPAPLGSLSEALAANLQQPQHDQQAAVTGLLNLPTWLADNYNLPGPRFDPHTGTLRLLPDNAPGQGGWGAAEQADLQGGIWGKAGWQPTAPLTSQQQLAGLVAHTQIVPRPFTTYLNRTWQAADATLDSSWQAILPSLSLAQTPAAVLDRLPRALHNFDQAVGVLSLTQSLDELAGMRGVDWVERLLNEALPTAPTLPPANAAAWKAGWFEDALVGLTRGGAPLPALPSLPEFTLGLNLGAR